MNAELELNPEAGGTCESIIIFMPLGYLTRFLISSSWAKIDL